MGVMILLFTTALSVNRIATRKRCIVTFCTEFALPILFSFPCFAAFHCFIPGLKIVEYETHEWKIETFLRQDVFPSKTVYMPLLICVNKQRVRFMKQQSRGENKYYTAIRC